MGKDLTCVVAGFGGQGSLFAGKVIATAGPRCAAAPPTAR